VSSGTATPSARLALLSRSMKGAIERAREWCGGRALFGLLLLACLPAAAAAQGLAPPSRPAFLPDAVPPQNEQGANFDLPLSDPTRPAEWFLAIYSGTTLGTYFYIASAVCRTLEATFDEHGIHCVPLRSAGVGGNVALMNEGRAQSIIVQSDTNYFAAIGQRPILGGRSALSLHDEIGVLVVRPDSDIERFEDIRGKRVNLGPEGSGTRLLWTQMLDLHGIGLSDLRRHYAATQDSNVLALCEGSIDAFAAWIGHPSELIKQAVDRCDARVVGIWSPEVAALVADTDYLFELTLPAGSYRNQLQAVQSYGFKASLVVHEELPAHVVYHLVKALVENVELFRAQHPALAGVVSYDFFAKGNSLPFHRGAERYYRERGWLRNDPPDGPLSEAPSGPGQPESGG